MAGQPSKAPSMAIKCAQLNANAVLGDSSSVLRDALTSIPSHLFSIRPSSESTSSPDFVLSMLDDVLDAHANHVHLLRHYTQMGSLPDAMGVHDSIIRAGVQPNIPLYKALLNMYYCLGDIKDANNIFQCMPCCDVQSYNIMMSCYLRHGLKKEALEIFKELLSKEVCCNNATFVILLKASDSVEDVKLIHAQVMEFIPRVNVFVESALLDLYAKWGSPSDALQVFSNMRWCNTVSWSSMIAGFVHCGLSEDALKAILQMQHEGVQFNEVTFINILRSFTNPDALHNVLKLHVQILKGGYECSEVANALIDAYAKSGSMKFAHLVFDNLPKKNVISWTSLILGYVQHGQTKDALNLFWKMEGNGVKPNNVTYSVVLRLCGSQRMLDLGKKIHGCISRNKMDNCLVMGNCLIDMYIKCGDIMNARLVFDEMGQHDVISWSAVIGGHAQQEEPDEAFELFRQMLEEGMKPNEVTYIFLLQGCACLATLEQGRKVHGFIVTDALEIDLFVGNTLIDMYCKGGAVKDAHKVFTRMPKHDLVSWNALLAGYCQHGYAKEAFELFDKMSQQPLKPDHVTSLSLLSVCRHAGLVEEGRHYFDIMIHQHHVKPNAEHCACMIDLLGRAGCLQEALTMIYKLSIDCVMVWMALLGACRISANVQVAEVAAESILKLAPDDTAASVMLSNIYAAAGEVGQKQNV